MDKEMRDEIRLLEELLQAVLEEEGYKIPKNQYSDDGYVGFDVPLRSGNGKTVLITINWI